ncbi:HAD-IA family hydrolase [candidate division WOR-3 bacterium]|nr:HAD-IA family hydrolase [candidate division WOR-3 bacterium]
MNGTFSNEIFSNERLVIFDLDGTLYKTDNVSLEAIQKALRDLHSSIPSEEKIKSLIGDRMEDICKELMPGSTPEEKEILIERIRAYEWEIMSGKAKLYEGMNAVLKELVSSGYTLAICSNGHRDYIDLVLSSLCIKNLFKYIKARHPVKSKGEQIEDILTMSKPSYAIVIGDRLHDINAARENNLPCIGAKYGYGGDEMLEADFIAESPNEIVSHITCCSIFAQIEKKAFGLIPKSPIIIGINGVDTSGKTQFSILLSRYLKSRGYKTLLIHLDDFHNPKRFREQGENEIDSYINNAFNLKLLKDEILSPVKSGGLVDKELTLLDLESDSFINKKHYHIDNQTIIILEGTLLYREPIDEFIDYRVYLDIDFEEVLKRAGQRDEARFGKEILEKYKNKYIPIQKRYIEKYLPKKRSDLVIDNTDYNHPMVK